MLFLALIVVKYKHQGWASNVLHHKAWITVFLHPLPLTPSSIYTETAGPHSSFTSLTSASLTLILWEWSPGKAKVLTSSQFRIISKILYFKIIFSLNSPNPSLKQKNYAGVILISSPLTTSQNLRGHHPSPPTPLPSFL